MLDLMIERAEQSAQDKFKVLSIKSDVLGDIEIKIPPSGRTNKDKCTESVATSHTTQ